jgi:hypothetical protein
MMYYAVAINLYESFMNAPRNKKGGQFMAVKKTAKKFKAVRREKV